MSKIVEAAAPQAGGPLGVLVVSFDGSPRNVLQGDIVLGQTGQEIPLEAGLKTITLATEGADSTTAGNDFTPSSRQVTIKGGATIRETFLKR